MLFGAKSATRETNERFRGPSSEFEEPRFEARNSAVSGPSIEGLEFIFSHYRFPASNYPLDDTYFVEVTVKTEKNLKSFGVTCQVV